MSNWLTNFLGFSSTAEAAIKADAATIVTKAKTLEQRVTDAFNDGLDHNVKELGSNPYSLGFTTPQPAALASSIVGSTVSNLVTIASKFGSSIDDLVAKIDVFEEELRQKRAARGAAVNALSSLVDDKALTTEEKTAISLEQADHAEDLVAAAMRNQPTPENGPTPSPAPAAPVFPQTTGQVLTPGTDATAGQTNVNA